MAGTDLKRRVVKGVHQRVVHVEEASSVGVFAQITRTASKMAEAEPKVKNEICRA